MLLHLSLNFTELPCPQQFHNYLCFLFHYTSINGHMYFAKIWNTFLAEPVNVYVYIVVLSTFVRFNWNELVEILFIIIYKTNYMLPFCSHIIFCDLKTPTIKIYVDIWIITSMWFINIRNRRNVFEKKSVHFKSRKRPVTVEANVIRVVDS